MNNRKLAGAKCLVTGGAGFIGHRLIEKLLEQGAFVRAVLYSKPARILDQRIDYITADLRALDSCIRVCSGMDFVFHCAANTQGAAVIRDDPLSHVTPNVPMNTYLLDAAHKAGVKRFVFISSGAAYPDTGHRPVEEHEMFTDEPTDVYYAVAWMKRYAEILCKTYATKIGTPMECAVVRPSNVYGPGDKFDPKTSHVTAALIRRVVLRQRPFEVWGTGEDVRDLIYIDDLLDGIMAAFHAPDPHLVVNLCSGEGVRVLDILKCIAEADGFRDIEIQLNPSKPSTVPVRRISAKFAKEKLGFTSKIDLADGIRRTLSWYREHRLQES